MGPESCSTACLRTAQGCVWHPNDPRRHQLPGTVDKLEALAKAIEVTSR